VSFWRRGIVFARFSKKTPSKGRERSRTRSEVHLYRAAQQFMPKEARGALKTSSEVFVRFRRRAVVALLPSWTMCVRSSTLTGSGQFCSYIRKRVGSGAPT
jgi:hypothetical protein